MYLVTLFSWRKKKRDPLSLYWIKEKKKKKKQFVIRRAKI